MGRAERREKGCVQTAEDERATERNRGREDRVRRRVRCCGAFVFAFVNASVLALRHTKRCDPGKRLTTIMGRTLVELYALRNPPCTLAPLDPG